MVEHNPDAKLLTTDRGNGIIVLSFDLKVCVVGGPETDALEAALMTQLDDQDVRALIIDFGNIDHINSTGLGVLIRANDKARKKRKRLIMAAVDKRIENIFVITKLALVFDVYPRVELAIASSAPST